MAFNPGGTNYQGFLDQRRMADEGTTRALDAEGKAAKAKRIADSKKRSGGQKLLSAVARGAAAYYTGGLSETMGGGQMIDKAMLGADAETNEYGELVGMASQVGGAMSAKKGMEMTSKLAAQDKADAGMQTRLDNLDPTGQMGMEFAMNREKKNKQNLEAMEAGKKGSFGGLFQGDIEGVNLEPTTVGDWETQIQKNEGGLMNMGDAKTTSQVGSSSLRGLDKTPSIMPKDVPQGSTSFGVSDTSRDVQPVSAGEAYKTPNSQYQLQGTERKQEQDDLISRLTDDTGKSGNEKQERKDKRNIDNWMRTDLTVQPQRFGDDNYTRALDPSTGTKWGRDYLNRNAIKSGRG